MEIMSRKRKLSTETSFLPQLKCYVNENIQNLRSEKKMKEIYSHTVNLLFKGAKQTDKQSYIDKNDKFRELKAVEGNFGGKSMPDWFQGAPILICNTCMSNSKLSLECNNCNMTLCERCAFECSSCQDPLCHSCVNLFHCGTADQPTCQRCSPY